MIKTILIKESFRLAWHAIANNILRTVLSLLGVTIGILAITTVFTIVDSLEKKGTKAISINTKNNNVIEVIPESEELGFVGKPNKINNDIIKNILEKNITPIISPLGLGKNNQTYNINGDTAASEIP